MFRPQWWLIVAALLCLAPSIVAAQTFPETGYRLDGRFASFWRENGGLPVFGFPISDQMPERGSEGVYSVQWLERERFELHPENGAPYDVLLGRLGDEALRRQNRDWRSAPPDSPQAGCRFFAETGRNLCEPFLSYWRSNGLEFDGRPGPSEAESLALFGFPLTAPAVETNSSGATVLTQWFERARFEYLPNNPAPYKILLGRLGAELYEPGRANFDPTSGSLPEYVQVRRDGWPTALEVPAGFTVEEVASGLNRPRFMAIDPNDGSLVYASDGASEVVRLRDTNGDGVYETRRRIAAGLEYVHSVAFGPDGALYAAAEDRVVRLRNFGSDDAAQQVDTILGGLPTGATDLYNHRTRTIMFGPDNKIYLSVGSSCDVCEETNALRAAVLRFNPDGSELEVFAAGLRNSVGIAFRSFSAELWGMDMGRNNLGPGLPPEELNRIVQGKNYGWPYCYGDRQPNPEFADPARCANTEGPAYTFPAHWAPLGMVFYDGLNFPPAYQGDALVAFHGSAGDQLGTRVGYNVVRVRFRDGQPVAHEDLLRGFIIGNDAWARPAGLAIDRDGSVLMSDDFGGRILRIRYIGR
ncbi:MAG: sorbosone dehydrogenase family protein [Oscillochloris sp.]|nr:sorbosone dehydrogenase family protein [Oscillochloris sp.]